MAVQAADPDKLLDLAFGGKRDPWSLSAARIHGLRRKFGDGGGGGGEGDPSGTPPASPLARYASRAESMQWGGPSQDGTSSDEDEVEEGEESFFFQAAPVAELTVESSKLGLSLIEVRRRLALLSAGYNECHRP